MGKSQREKGKRLEREAAKLLEAIYPDARRSAMQAAGAHDPDIVGTDWWVEVSGGKAPSPHSKFKQAEADSAVDGRPPLVMTKRDGGPWLVSMWVGDFIKLVREANGGGACEPFSPPVGTGKGRGI
jgi:hypothetical protein